MSITTVNAVTDVIKECNRQDEKWGEQNHEAAVWLTILAEEVGESARAILDYPLRGKAGEALRDELIQVAAVAVQWIGYIDRDGAR